MNTRFITIWFTALVVIAPDAGRLFAQSLTVKPSNVEITVTPPVLDIDVAQWQVDALDWVMADVGREIGDAIAMKVDAKLNEKLAEKLEAKFQNQRSNPPNPRPTPRPIIVRGGNNEDRLYQSGTRSLDNGRWDEATQSFTKVMEINGTRADGACYWIAWAHNKQGNGAGALEWLARLRQSFPNSRWVAEGRVLEAEIKQAAGQPVRPENEPDDDLKLIALNNLMKADEERAIPMVEKLLKGTGSPKLKERALFVLAQSNSARARQVVSEIARGNGNPDLQAKALSYLGAIGGAETRQTLLEAYKSSTNVDVKRSIIRALTQSGDRDRLLEVARTESVTDLRAEAVQQLAAMGANDELWQLYAKESSPDVKRRIIQSMFTTHNQDRLIQLLKTETDSDLLRSVIRNLGMMPSQQSADALVAVYGSNKDESVRRAVIDVFTQQRNAKQLIDLARKETDPQIKRLILQRLSGMKSPEATEYFLELLNKP